MRYFPLFVDLDGQVVVIVGGGEKSLQKLRLLVKSRAVVTVIARAPSPELRALANAHGVTISEQAFAPRQIDDARLVFVATDDAELARSVCEAASARGILVNVVDRPDRSSFLVPALVDRDPIVVAIGSEGTAPVLARDIRAHIEALLPARIGAVARSASELRPAVKRIAQDPTMRKRIWERLLRGVWRDRLLVNDVAGAAQQLEQELAAVTDLVTETGHVSLVGAGPGDADLLTLRAQQRLQEADVVVVDGLVPDVVIEHARRDARRIRVGKEGYGPATAQSEINRILVREAAKGRKVVRLKGGDPFVFGRAAEELAAVRAAGIPVDVVPGITAAHACAASIGLPLTLREKVRQFSLVTGATASGLPDLDWQGLARPGHAFAIYMGLRTAPAIVSRLLAAGADPDLPVVIVENGTRTNERVLRATLVDLPMVLAAAQIKGPTVVFVGLEWEAAHLSAPARVEWFGTASGTATVAPNGRDYGRLATAEETAPKTHWPAG